VVRSSGRSTGECLIEAMRISNVMILRDGGTILFEISGDALGGDYRLQTPFSGKPQPLFRGERKLEFGSAEEMEVASKLKTWLGNNLTDELNQSLAELDDLKEWRNLPEKFSQAIPFHRIRNVLRVLEARLGC
jgi:hypothetical protein